MPSRAEFSRRTFRVYLACKTAHLKTMTAVLDLRKHVFLLAKVSAFCRNLEEQFYRRNYHFDWLQSWSDTLQHWQSEGCDYRIGIVDLDLVSSVGKASIDCLRAEVSRRDLPLFVIKENRPTPQEMLRYMREGVVGAVLRDAPIEETMYRIEAYLAFRGPEHFARPPRIDFSNPVRVSPIDSPSFPSEIGLGCNLSRTGILVNTWYPPQMGERVLLEFEVPEAREPMHCLGEVRRIVQNENGPAATGIAFVDLSDSDERMLTQHVLNGLRMTHQSVDSNSC